MITDVIITSVGFGGKWTRVVKAKYRRGDIGEDKRLGEVVATRWEKMAYIRDDCGGEIRVWKKRRGYGRVPDVHRIRPARLTIR